MRPHIVKSEQLRVSTWARRGGYTRPELGWSCERAFRGGQPRLAGRLPKKTLSAVMSCRVYPQGSASPSFRRSYQTRVACVDSQPGDLTTASRVGTGRDANTLGHSLCCLQSMVVQINVIHGTF